MTFLEKWHVIFLNHLILSVQSTLKEHRNQQCNIQRSPNKGGIFILS